MLMKLTPGINIYSFTTDIQIFLEPNPALIRIRLKSTELLQYLSSNLKFLMTLQNKNEKKILSNEKEEKCDSQ